jgi:hypothetical protein
MSANDTHLPSNFDPMAYRFVGAFDSQPEPGSFMGAGPMTWATEWGMQPGTNPLNAEYGYLKRLLEASPSSRYGERQSCDHCGAHIRYVVVVLHAPTGDHIAMGETCIDRVGSMDRATWKVGELRKAAQAARKAAATREAKERNRDNYPELAAWIDAHAGRWIPAPVFAAKRVLDDGGTWTDDNTATAIEAADEYDAEDRRRAIRDAEREANKKPAPTGRVAVVGEVVKVVWKDSDYGGAWKMTVLADDGYMAWGTVPGTIVELHYQATRFQRGDEDYQLPAWLKGRRVKFTAALEPSEKDPCFAFYKRPTKAELLPITEGGPCQ